jgi:hypothetical protein
MAKGGGKSGGKKPVIRRRRERKNIENGSAHNDAPSKSIICSVKPASASISSCR